MAKDAKFKPDYRDMNPERAQRETPTLLERKAKALRSRAYRSRNPDKINNYEVSHPILRLRLKSDDLVTLKKMATAFEETPQKLVRRVVLDMIREFRSRTK